MREAAQSCRICLRISGEFQRKMPELPEAETMRRYLSRLVVGTVIRQVEVLRQGSLKGQRADEFRRLVQGKTIGSIGRRGKALILELSEGMGMIFRLGMSGRLIYHPHATAVQSAECGVQSHDRVIFCLEDGGRLVFQDLRGFGKVRAMPQQEVGDELKGLGVEPLGRQFTWESLEEALRRTKMPVKVALLDQSRVCGVGNIYASEILHRCGVHPGRRPQDLRQEEWRKMALAMKQVLREAIRAGGSSISDYLKPDGSPGGYQNRLRVYGREGKQCYRCGSTIVRIKQGGRSSFYCPRCQPVRAVTSD